MKLSALKSDSAVRETGDWVKEIPNLGDIEFKVRGIGNADYRRLEQSLLRGVSHAEKRSGKIAIPTQDKITSELLLETILLDWRNLTDSNEVEIPYTKEKARELLTHPDFVDFREGVAWAGAVVAKGNAEDDKAAVRD